MTTKKKLGTVCFYVVAILLAVIAMIPFLWMISTSFKSRGALMSIPIQWIPEEPTLAAYIKVFSKFPFAKTIGNSLFISVSYTIITLLSSSMAAFAFAKLQFPGNSLLLRCYLATMMIPTQVTMIPLFVVMNRMGLIDSYASVILPSVFRPFAVFMLVQQMRTIPNDFLDAARIDGANVFQIFRKVALPLCIPSLATLSITTFMESWNDYLWQLIMIADKGLRTTPIGIALFSQGQITNTGYQLMAAMIATLPMLIIFLSCQKFFVKGITIGGVKG